VSPEKIAELRELLAKATPGPWEVWDKRGRPLRLHWREDPADPSTWTGKSGPGDWGIKPFMPKTLDDAHLIVAAVNALPELLDAASLLRPRDPQK